MNKESRFKHIYKNCWGIIQALQVIDKNKKIIAREVIWDQIFS